MKLEILKEIENKLFDRKEVIVTIDSEITPSHQEVEKLLSEHFKTKIENIKIKKIKGKFGYKTFTILANIYSSKKEKDATELKKKRGIEREKNLVEQKTKSDQPIKSDESKLKEEIE